MMTTPDQNKIHWNAKYDAFRPTTDFSDLLKIVASYYEMYNRAVTFLAPWIAKQRSANIFLPPDRDTLKESLGRERPQISFRARNCFVEALMDFTMKHKGAKTLINPNPASHHSAQFPHGTFEIKSVTTPLVLRDDKAIRSPAKTLHKIELAGANMPIYIENLTIPPDQIKFIIVRPKLGKLGTPSTSRWEVLVFKQSHGYLVDHVDSDLNPRWSGIF